MGHAQEYIFYLQLTEELPESFFLLAKKIVKYDIHLIPVHPNDLNNFNESSRHYLIAQITDMASLNLFREVRLAYLDMALMNKRFILYHLSSFGPLVMPDKIERTGTYYHFPLPLPYVVLTRAILGLYYREKKQLERWPGGRRCRLSPLIMS